VPGSGHNAFRDLQAAVTELKILSQQPILTQTGDTSLGPAEHGAIQLGHCQANDAASNSFTGCPGLSCMDESCRTRSQGSLSLAEDTDSVDTKVEEENKVTFGYSIRFPTAARFAIAC